MKKLLLTASALVLGLGLAHNAAADCNGMYLGVRGGVVKYKDNAKSNSVSKTLDKEKLMLSGALGYRYDYFRAELEYIWRDKNNYTYHADGVTGKVNFKSYSYMLNGYIDLAPYSWFTPYISAGIGFTKLKYSETITSDLTGQTTKLTTDGNYTPTRFTWSVGGGASIKVTNRFNVDAGYRYYDMNSIRHLEINAHEIYGGVRYVF